MALTSSLNLWDKNNSNITNSAALALDGQVTSGFQSNQYLKSGIFNGILRETTLVTKSLIDALGAVTSTYSGTLAVSTATSATDLSSAIVSILNGLTVANATNATSTGKATNLAGGSASAIPYQSAANTTTFLGKGTNGYILVQGTSAPEWKDPSTIIGSGGSADDATNLKGGSAGDLPYQQAAGTTKFVSAGTSGYILKCNGTSAPSWVNPADVIGGSVGVANSLAGGATGSLPYQTAADTTAFLSKGSNGYVLTQGANSPAWTDPATLSVLYAASAGTAGSASTAASASSASNISGGAKNKIPYQIGSGATSFTGAASSGDVLGTSSDGTPTWVAASGLSVSYAATAGSANTAGSATSADSATTATTATNLAGTIVGSIPVQTASGTTGYVVPATDGNVLTLSSGSPAWTAPSNLSVGYATSAGSAVSATTAFGLSSFSMSYSGNILSITYANA